MSGQKIMLQVAKGRLVPADRLAEDQLREKGYRVGDAVNAEITKARSPGYHKLAHAFGQLVADNIEEFAGLDSHQCLKRLQWLADIECEHVAVSVPGMGMMEARWPNSLSYSSMDQARFERTLMAMARYVAEKYWHDEVDAEDVIDMANEIMGVAA